MSCESLDLCGKPFEVKWRSGDERTIGNGETYYLLTPFECTAKTASEALRKARPLKIEPCWIVNSTMYESNASKELAQWSVASLPTEARTRAGHYLPPEAKGLSIEPPEENEARHFPRESDSEVPAQTLQEFVNSITGQFPRKSDSEMPPEPPSTTAEVCQTILLEHLGGPKKDPPTAWALNDHVPGLRAFKATLPNGGILYLKDVAQCPMPSEALAFFRQATQQKDVAQLVDHTRQTEGALQETQAAMQKAQETASLTLEEALSQWMRLSVPGMKAETVAKIKEALARYVTDPDSRSLAKIATQFNVSRKTVSTWFATFTKATGFPVVRHKRHESVTAQLRAEIEIERHHGNTGEDNGEESNGRRVLP